MRPVPTNQLQQQLNKTYNENLSPGTGTIHSALGIIIEVYDVDSLTTKAIDKQLWDKLQELHVRQLQVDLETI